MSSRVRLGWCLSVLALLLGSVGHAAGADEKDGFTPLFNGKDLSGWTPYLREPSADPNNTWSVVDGVLICKGKPNGYIATKKQYGNYVLRLKWRFPADSKGGNSGVLLHVQEKDKIWPNSVEAQLFAGSAGDFWLIADDSGKLPELIIDPERKDPKNKEGRHYFRIGKDEKIEKPFGEWNEYEIHCQDGNIKLIVNGKVVNEGKATAASLKQGRIALQSEGAEIHFKDIEIKPMN
jgi:hypothetical protein